MKILEALLAISIVFVLNSYRIITFNGYGFVLSYMTHFARS